MKTLLELREERNSLEREHERLWYKYIQPIAQKIDELNDQIAEIERYNSEDE